MASKHPRASALVGSGLFEGISAFADLENRIGALGTAENTKAIGDAFEIFVEGYLATQQKMLCDEIWLVSQIPADTRNRLNLPNDPKGIDGVFRTRLGSEVPYQVKFRSNREYLTYTELAPFLGLTERGISDRIVFTNSNELAGDVKNRDGVRTVRGIDFDELTREELEVIACWLRGKPTTVERLAPRPYQQEALTRISDTMSNNDRATVVMACGTGKTLLALWAVEALKPKTVLVLVPSLSLLQQTLGEWSKHTSWGDKFSYLCVCSDPTVTSKDEVDAITLASTDLDFRVDTDPEIVRSFISDGRETVKVVFCTYQSSKVVSEAVRGLEPIDVAVFDEAHKTTGPKGGTFAHCLIDETIRIKKRVFFTATPRHYDIRHRDKDGDFRLISMDDESIYGTRAYTLTFGAAAKQGIICDYKVVISVVDKSEVSDFALKHGVTLIDGDLIGTKWVANQIAVQKAIEKTGAKRAITFHSRVSSAKAFAAEGPHGAAHFLPTFSVFHVNGDQSSAERRSLLNEFKRVPQGLITNARCLTEGIDVPAVDMVAFVDPRQSKIDIAQATGRAMRKPRGVNKQYGYVVVPLFLDANSDVSISEALEESEFSEVANVLNAMQEQDEDLVQIIRDMMEARGRGEVFDPQRLSEKVEVLGPPIELSALRSGIFAEIVESIGVSWDEWYGRLKTYKNREGDCLVPVDHKEGGFKLGLWVGNQRQENETLSTERKHRLNELGFVWDVREAAWERGFSHLKMFHEREGHCSPPARHKESQFQLGAWVRNLRERKGDLSAERLRRLNELGFVWDAHEAEWERGFQSLCAFYEREGHFRISQKHTENGINLGTWVGSQRLKKDTLSDERKRRLDHLGFPWNPWDVAWERGFSFLKSFYEREGHCRVPFSHSEGGFKLGSWTSTQRSKRDSHSPDRLRQLNELGFEWEVLDDDWERGFSNLKSFYDREGHLRVPRSHKENGFLLASWIGRQRQSKETMSAARLLRLNELGFVWDPHEAAWEQGFSYLKSFYEREGHCRVPASHRESGFNLNSWMNHQRVEDLVPERRQKLSDLGFVWDPYEAAWEKGFSYLKLFYEREGHCRVPVKHRENGFNLGSWVSNQRTRKKYYSSDRIDRLNELGFVWDTRPK
jgi:superfamily II DNA or RNA helicase